MLISQRVLVECEWLLRSRYGLAKEPILGAFSGLLDSTEVRTEEAAGVNEAPYVGKDSGAGFADCLIAAKYRARGYRSTISFDARAAKLPGSRLA